MFLEQVFECPIIGELSGIPEYDVVGINAYLYGRGIGIIFVGNGIEKGFAQGRGGECRFFLTGKSFVGDGVCEVFGCQEVNGPVDLEHEWAMYFVLKSEVVIGGAEEADFYVCSGDVFFGIGMEKEDGSAF